VRLRWTGLLSRWDAVEGATVYGSGELALFVQGGSVRTISLAPVCFEFGLEPVAGRRA